MPAQGRAALLFAFSAPASGHAFCCFSYPRRLGRSNMGDYPLLWLGFRPVRCLLSGCDIMAMTPVDTACSRPSSLRPQQPASAPAATTACTAGPMVATLRVVIHRPWLSPPALDWPC